jgi:hypothetical protein
MRKGRNSMRAFALLAVAAVFYGCAGSPTQTPTQRPASTTAAPASPTASEVGDGSANPAAALCVLTPADWQAFNYVTSATPSVTSDEAGTAICQYASGLYLEMYTHQSSTDAAATLQTILENAPFDAPQELTLPGADKAVFDSDVGDDHAGIAVQKGKLAFAIYGLSRDSAQTELMALAGLVLQRASNLT